MNFWLQVLIGGCIGIIFGFLTIATTINKKDNELKAVWNNLVDCLNIRYRTLRKILSLFFDYMEEKRDDITALSELCSNAIDEMTELSYFSKRLENENKVNDKLELIKQEITNYPDLINSEKYNELIEQIYEKETAVGEAIRLYNAYVLEFKVLLETFPFSFVSWILNKNPDDYKGFNIMQIEEFSTEIIDEDEI